MDPLFIRRIEELLGSAEAQRLIEVLGTPPSISIRLNPRKQTEASRKEILSTLPIDTEVPWCPDGVYLSERPLFAADPLWSLGAYYVQDASSMFYTHILRNITDPHRPVRYLDACAAPGGKTTCALSVLHEDSLVVANEYVTQRANILNENIRKWGASDAIITNSDTAPFSRLKSKFDIIAVDAPCSGEGMMRKESAAVSQWSPSLVQQCADMQWEIAGNLWPILEEGGYMIYSTCTFNRTENEEIVERICNELGAETIKIEVQPEWGISPGIGTNRDCYRFMPHLTRGEGLFVSILRKPSDGKQASGLLRSSQTINHALGATHYALRKEESELIKHLTRAGIRILSPGAPVGEQKGAKELIPTAENALSWHNLLPGETPRVEISREQALQYLRREALTLPPDTPRGYVTLTYLGLPIGPAKNLGNRANNLWPKHWRLRTV